MRNGGLATLTDVGSTTAATFVLTFMSARMLSVEQFGVYGAVMTGVLIVQSLVQGGLIDPQMRLLGCSDSDGFWSVERYLPWVAILGVAGMAVSLLAGPVALAGIWLAAGCACYLYLRAAWVRAYFVRSRSPWASALISLTTLVVVSITSTAAVWWAQPGWQTVVVVHLVSLLFSPGLSHSIMRKRLSGEKHEGDGWNLGYAAENLVIVSAIQASSLVAMPALGLAFSAGLRGASLIMGPVNVMLTSVRLLLMGKIAGHPRPRKAAVRNSLAVGALTAVWGLFGGILLFLMGELILGASAAVAISMLPLVALTFVAQGMYIVAFVSARALLLDAEVRQARSSQLVVVVMSTALAIITRSWEVYLVGSSLSSLLAYSILIRRIPKRHPRLGKQAS